MTVVQSPFTRPFSPTFHAHHFSETCNKHQLHLVRELLFRRAVNLSHTLSPHFRDAFASSMFASCLPELIFYLLSAAMVDDFYVGSRVGRTNTRQNPLKCRMALSRYKRRIIQFRPGLTHLRSDLLDKKRIRVQGSGKFFALSVQQRPTPCTQSIAVQTLDPDPRTHVSF